MLSHKAQVAVLGAGPAGAVTARQMGLAGLDVVLIDPFVPVTGHRIESFPASGAPLAEETGLLRVFCEASDGPAEAMHMQWRDSPETRRFEGKGPLLLHRESLHVALREEAGRYTTLLQARVQKVITSVHGARVRTSAGEVCADLVIDARGRQARKQHKTDLTALPFAAQGDLPAFSMWLEAMAQGWIWVSALPDGTLHGAVFQPPEVLAGMGTEERLTYLAACFSRSANLNQLHGIAAGKPMAAGFSAVDDPLVSARHLLVGDAALARDPIASHGLVHALRSGVQAAVAAKTILDPDLDTRAAHSFLRHKHRAAVAAARFATQGAYADQCRFMTKFWADMPLPEPPAALPRVTQGLVTLAAPLTRAAVLGHDRIHWAPAIKLLAVDDFLTEAGGLNALDVAAACRPAASLHEIANRLGRQHDRRLVFRVLERLTLGGAFVQAGLSV